MKTSSSRIRGFSLIELMVVIFIIGIITAFAVPAVTSILKGSQLAQGSQTLIDQLNLARQTALSKNHPVEVRLIRYADPEVPGEVTDPNVPGQPSNGAYRAIQILETLDAIDQGTGDFVRLPVDKPQLLPQSIVINRDRLSTILSDAGSFPTTPSKNTAGPKDPPMTRKVGTNYDYVWFRFMPDGSTNLPPKSSDPNGAWCVTLQNLTDPATGNTPPHNFFTVQVDPVSGAMKQFRPGLAPQ